MTRHRILASVVALGVLTFTAHGQSHGQSLGGLPEVQPEPATTWGWRSRPATIAASYMVSAANPLAVAAGLEVLRSGGTAADAAIALQLVLNLVEPQSSGLGGGAFVLHWQAAGKQLKSYDGRETAPAAARPDRFLVDGRPMKLGDAIFGGASVGVPGTLRLLEAIHKEHGRLPWAQLFVPAIALSEQGFRVSPRLHLLLRWYGARASRLRRGATSSTRRAAHARLATCSGTPSSPRRCAPSPSGEPAPCTRAPSRRPSSMQCASRPIVRRHYAGRPCGLPGQGA